jgi:hypothetical protein
LARQHDLTQNNPLETPCLSSLCCRSDFEDVLVNLIQLTCQLKYVKWQACWIKYKNTPSNTFLKHSPLMLLCCFKLFNYLSTFFKKNPMSFAMKTYKKSNLNTVWCCSNCIIRKYLEFQIYNLKPRRLGGLWRFT